jgi:Tfp pilus assembly protein PilF
MKSILRDIENYSQWIAKSPTAGTFLLRASAHALMGDHKAAVLDAKKALDMEPENHEVLTRLATFMVHRGEYAQAHGLAKKAHKLNAQADDLIWMVTAEGTRLSKKISESPTAALYHKRGLLSLHQGAYLPAKADFEAAIRIDPSLDSAYTHLATVFIKLNEPLEAERVLDEVSDRNPAYTNADLLKVKQWSYLERKAKHSPSEHTHQELLKFCNAEQTIHTLTRAEELQGFLSK